MRTSICELTIIRWSAALTLMCLPVQLRAATVQWTNSFGGLFSTTANWSPNTVPADSDTVAFTNLGSYNFMVDVAATNFAALFNQGSITQSVSAAVWRVTDHWRVGEAFGQTSVVSAIAGTMIVTNSSGSALLSVGGAGTGELAIRGASVIADQLLATQGKRSLLTLSHGELTTLGGLTLSNGGTLSLGTTSGGLFTWNASGGTNRIDTGPFEYGGLTLGKFGQGSGRARVNLSGSNTSLTVPGLDTYGGNELRITQGASFHTRLVQLGLHSNGSSNLVEISGPGSAWINEYLMYFGMHSGAQTLIITNGGYLKTGGTTYLDQRFTAFDNEGNRIIVTGSNSWFHSDGTATMGISYSSTVKPLDNIFLVDDGGRFSARQLRYGSTNLNLGHISRPGNLINIAHGSMWIGSLEFAVGGIRIGSGNGVIDSLNMVGGTNAVLEVGDDLYVGHEGDLGAGELRIGGASSTIPSLNGEVHAGGFQIGALPGCIGVVNMTGGRAFITNATQDAALIVGNGGDGTLRVSRGDIHADATVVSSTAQSSGSLVLDGARARLYSGPLIVGAGGVVVASNAATLHLSHLSAPAFAVSTDRAVLEFSTATPSIPTGAITATNTVISFRNVEGANIELNDPSCLGRIVRHGQTDLRLVNSTNAPLASLSFRDQDPSTWSKLILSEGTTRFNVGSMLIETNSSLTVTDTSATIAGLVTNRGQLNLTNSTLRFLDPVVLSGTTSIRGLRGVIRFDGALHLPSTDVIVQEGISIQAASISSDGGKLVFDGGGVIRNEDGSVTAEMFLVQKGWVTHIDDPAAPTTPPSGLTGPLGLELIRSTNVIASSPVFTAGTSGYERLRLSDAGHWQSDRLTIGTGAAMTVMDTSASVSLSTGEFRVEQGGVFRDQSGGTNYTGFSPTSNGATTSVSGDGSIWQTLGTTMIGGVGSENQMLVESGGTVLSHSVVIGGNNTSSNNSLTVQGSGATMVATNGLSLLGHRTKLLIQTGGVVQASQIIANGDYARISLIGAGAAAYCSDQVVLSQRWSPELRLADGAALFTSNGVLNAWFGSAELSGAGTQWDLTGNLTVGSQFVGGFTNLVAVRDGATLNAGSLALSSGSAPNAFLLIDSGQVNVTNTQGLAVLSVNGLLELSGGKLKADRLLVGNPAVSAIKLHSGQVEWAGSDFPVGMTLQLGNATNSVSLNLLGGTNVCRGGVEIRPFAQLTGNGSIIGNVTNHGWFWPASITIQGDLELDATSDVRFTLAGEPGSLANSFLATSGKVTLAGSLAISVSGGFLPAIDQSFVLIQGQEILSGFDNVAFGQRCLTTDGLASFRIETGGGMVVATDFASEDLDGDFIQDAWAIQHFGISPLLPGDGLNDLDGDWDGDGLSNRNEFALGSDPTDATSALFVQVEATSIEGVKIRFPHFPGRSHWVSTSTGLQAWADSLIEELEFEPDGTAVWFDTRTAGTFEKYYRLMIK